MMQNGRITYLYYKLTESINHDITALDCRKDHSYFSQETKHYWKKLKVDLEKQYPIKVKYNMVWKEKQRAMKKFVW